MNTFFQGTIAVLGATQDKNKYGYKVFKALQKQHPNKKIIPINPRYKIIDTIPCKNNLNEIDEPINTLVMIVNPKIGIKILQSILNKNIKNIWFQPGADNKLTNTFCKEHNINYSTNSCILLL